MVAKYLQLEKMSCLSAAYLENYLTASDENIFIISMTIINNESIIYHNQLFKSYKILTFKFDNGLDQIAII